MMEVATEMKFLMQVPGNETCDESHNPNEIYNAKQQLVVNELKSVELNLLRNQEPKSNLWHKR